MTTPNPSLRNAFVRSQSSNSGHNGSFPSPKTKTTRREGSSGPMKESTTVVFPNVPDMDSLQRLVAHIESQVLLSPVKSHYYRSGQKSGFIYFHEESDATCVREKMNSVLFNGISLRALAPSQFQRDAASFLPHTSPDLGPIPEPVTIATTVPSPTPSHIPAAAPSLLPQQSSFKSLAPFPAINMRSSSTLTNSSFISGVGDGSAGSTVMVLRNLNFSLRNDKLLEFLNMLNISPVSVNYHFDKNGLFRGIVFVKFKTIEDASDAIEKANGQELCGRTIRAGFQRNGPGTHAVKLASPGAPPGFNFSPGRRAISLILPNAVSDATNNQHLSHSDPPEDLFETEAVPTVLIERSSSEALRSREEKENHVLSHSAPPPLATKGPESSDEEICSAATTDDDLARGSPESSEHMWTASSRESTPQRKTPGTSAVTVSFAPKTRTGAPPPPRPVSLFPTNAPKGPGVPRCRVIIHDGLEFVAVPEKVVKETAPPVPVVPLVAQSRTLPVIIAGGEFN